MKKRILVLVSMLTITFSAKAQTVDGLEAVLLAGDDAEKLIGAYITPAMTGLIHGMNSGWYHTAKVHKLFGFDISVGLNASFAPSEEEIFRFADLGLSSNITSSSPTAATVVGSNNLAVPVTFNGTVSGQTVSASFDMPSGIEDDLPLGGVPTPAVQFSMGLPWKLEGTLRLVPSVGSDDVKGNLVGIGVKKEITNWFGPLEKTPLHVSLLAAYTTMNVDYDIQNDSSIAGTGQAAEFNLNSFNLEAIASLNFPVINVFGGIGVSTGSSDLRMLGTYDLEYEISPGVTLTESTTDPVDLSFDDTSFKATLGARLSLGFFKIYGSYIFQEFSTLNAGIAFSFR